MDIEIPDTIKVGGLDYTVIFGRSLRLAGNLRKGETRYAEQVIAIDDTALQQQINEVMLHELLHAVDNVYNADCLTEDEVNRLAHGLHQVFEQLGINFISKDK